MNDKCPVCESTDFEIRGQYRAHHGMLKGLDRAECLNCGMFFATPMPSQLAIDDYNSSYFDTAHGGQNQSRLASAFFSGIAKLRVAHLRRYLIEHNIVVNSVMECGPGLGHFARNWLALIPNCVYYALETDQSCHKPLGNIGVTVVEEQSELHGEKLDLVVMSHVLEHVAQPADFISSSCRNLKKGGGLFIEVPCNDWKHKSLDEPHLLFFDKEPLRHLLSSQGFTNIELSYHGTAITELQVNNPLKNLFTRVRNKLLSKGLVFPFGWRRKGMEALSIPIERAAVAPFNAHIEPSEPAWWLRAVATKL